jgi:UDP-N-acetylmuramate dehydrogenase
MRAMTNWAELFVESFPGTVVQGARIGAQTTYRVGGLATIQVVVEGEDELSSVATAWAHSGRPPVYVLGAGSNTLVLDGGFDGVVVKLGDQFSGIMADSEMVELGGALMLPIAARRLSALGLRGLEWAVGVPGTVGGAVRMNAGGHGSEIAEALVDADVFDLAAPENGVVRRPASSLALGYRHSNLSSTELVLGARFSLHRGEAEASRAELSSIVSWRRAHQPGGQNAGSVFRNPEGGDKKAAQLIEEAGLKGSRVGTAEVSSKHANFIQSSPDGSADDVEALIVLVGERVRDRFGVELVTEIRRVGITRGGETHG